MHKRDALDFLATHTSPGLILLDLGLPDISGFDVLAEIRQNISTKNIPVVMLTGSDDENNIKHCYRLGANSYIVKPDNPARFEEVVQTLGFYWVVFNAISEHPDTGLVSISEKQQNKFWVCCKPVIKKSVTF